VWRISVYTVVLLAAINSFSYVDRAALALVLPFIQRDLHLSDTALGLVSGLPFSVCYALGSLPAAYIADRLSRRNLIAIGFAFWSAMTALSGMVTSGLQLACARLALGAGESTGLPSMASMIADLFSGRGRAAAFAVIAASPNIGVLVGFPAVAWVMHRMGWRAAFFAAGVPGLLLAILFFLTVREPKRRGDGIAGSELSVSTFREGLAFLAGSRSYVLVVIAGALISINIGSFIAWAPTFMMRMLHQSPQQVGSYFGTFRGIAGLLGAIFAGVLANALARRDEVWRVWLPALAELLLFPADALFLFASSPLGWRGGLMLDAVLNSVQIATTYTLFVSVAKTRTRAASAAIYFLVCSLVGLTCGPALVGTLNDILRPRLGDGAIRYTMLLAAATSVGAGVATLLAARYWKQDVERANR